MAKVTIRNLVAEFIDIEMNSEMRIEAVRNLRLQDLRNILESSKFEKSLLTYPNSIGYNILHHAIVSGDPRIIEYVFSRMKVYQIDITKLITNSGDNIFHIASYFSSDKENENPNGFVNLVKICKKYNIDFIAMIKSRNYKGKTPVECLEGKGFEIFVRYLQDTYAMPKTSRSMVEEALRGMILPEMVTEKISPKLFSKL
ncbi:MAG: hypothetical protein J0H68_01750 [Sphingobacteriia bacterium]|nr:hypothetical protein [Sphingobacteriia bacterium]